MLSKLLCIWRRFRMYRNAIPSASAFRLALAQGRRPKVNVLLPKLNRTVCLRTLTSDVECFTKVFIASEYAVPFSLKPKFIVDAGANVGFASLFFRAEYPEARIVAIEPEASNFELLAENCGGVKGIALHKAALWPERRELKICDKFSQKWSFSVTEGEVGDAPGTLVQSVTVPEIMAEAKVDRIDLLKLDIETAEKDLFSRNTDAWLDRVGLIIIELHDRMRDGCSRQFYEAIRKYPYHQEVRGENVFVKLQ